MIHPIRLIRSLRRVRFAQNFYGPKPSFVESDFYRFLWLLRGCRKSRRVLSCELAVGEGSVRTMIRALSEQGLIDVRRRGCGLTLSGEKTLARLGVSRACFVPATSLSYGRRAFALVLRAPIVLGIEWRDEAVKAGAEGVTLAFVKNGGLELPACNYRIKRGDEEKIMRILGLSKASGKAGEGEGVGESGGAREGDAVLLSYAFDSLGSQRGAWAAALFLSEKR